MGKTDTHTFCISLTCQPANIIYKIPGKIRLCIFLLLFLPFFTHSQTATPSDVIDAAAIDYASSINEYVLFQTRDNPVADDSIPYLDFTKKIPGKNSMRIPYEMISKTLYLKFMMKNTTDSLLQVYFYPCIYYKK